MWSATWRGKIAGVFIGGNVVCNTFSCLNAFLYCFMGNFDLKKCASLKRKKKLEKKKKGTEYKKEHVVRNLFN